MAIKRADIREILAGLEVTDAHISKLMTLIHTETDALKDERDSLQTQLDEAKENGGKDANSWKAKYEKEHSDFESYKADQTKKETEANKRTALKELLKDSKLSEKGQERALKYADLESIELDDKGAIKGGKKLLDAFAEEWSDYVTDTQQEGQNTPNKDTGASGSKSGSPMTREEIMNIQDTLERQQAIATHSELFGF